MTPRSLLAPARLAGLTVLRGQDDGRLVDLTRAGCEPAFEAIVGRYRRPLLRYCRRLVPDDRAEDVVQQAFVRAYDAMLRNGDELDLRPWLYRIAHNTALNALRDRASRHEPLSEDLDGAERPDQAAERRQRIRDALAGVRALPERQRDAILLREVEGRSYEEIAGELGVSGGAVRALLNRARSTLRAGASALTPAGLLARIPWAAPAEPGVRVTELCGGAGAGAAVAKVCATVLATGAVVGGAAIVPGGHSPSRPSGQGREAAASPARDGTPMTGAPLADRVGGPGEDGLGRRSGRGPAGQGGRSHGGRKRSGPQDGRSGPGGGPGPGERSGPGSGAGSGSGSGGSGPGPGASGASGSGSSGSGSGSGSSGSGSGGSGSSGSGSSGSGSGETASASGSGSGSSGSGSGSSGSGSGSSGSGSGSSGYGSSGDPSSEGSGSSSTEG